MVTFLVWYVLIGVVLLGVLMYKLQDTKYENLYKLAKMTNTERGLNLPDNWVRFAVVLGAAMYVVCWPGPVWRVVKALITDKK